MLLLLSSAFMSICLQPFASNVISWVQPLQPPSSLDCGQLLTCVTRHRASTSTYSLTFCVRVMSPKRHHWKPAVHAATVMLRTPPITRQWPASSACRPCRAFALCRHILGWTQACNKGSRYVAIATQPVPRLQVRPIVTTRGQPLPRPQVTSRSMQ